MQQGLGRGQRRTGVPVWWQGTEAGESTQPPPGKMARKELQPKEGPSTADSLDWWDSDTVTGGASPKASGPLPGGEETQAIVTEGSPEKKLEGVSADGSTKCWGEIEIPDIPVDEPSEDEAEWAPKLPLLEDITEEEEEEESMAVGDEAELDEAIEATGKESDVVEGEDLNRIRGMAETAKASPYMQELMGVENPIIMGYVYAAGLRKVQELELVHGEREKKDLLSYSQLARRFNVDKKELQKCCVAGKLKAEGKKRKQKPDKRIVKFRKNVKNDPEADPSSSQAAAEMT